MNQNGQTTRRMQLRSIFNNPSNLYRRGAIGESLYGITGQGCQAFDPIFSEDVCETNLNIYFGGKSKYFSI